MSIQNYSKDREIIKEYYLFLYDLAVKKKYENSSQLTDEEKRYCEKLLAQNESHYKSNKLYLSLMDDILTESIRRKTHVKR